MALVCGITSKFSHVRTQAPLWELCWKYKHSVIPVKLPALAQHFQINDKFQGAMIHARDQIGYSACLNHQVVSFSGVKVRL